MVTTTSHALGESGSDQSMRGTERRPWGLTVWWAAATALWSLSTLIPPVLAIMGFSGNTPFIWLALISLLLLPLGIVAQYLVLQRGILAAGGQDKPNPKSWITGSLTATAIAYGGILITFLAGSILAAGVGAYEEVSYALMRLLPAAVVGALVGRLIGSVQWDKMRRYLAECGWVGRSTVGWLLGYTAFFLMGALPGLAGMWGPWWLSEVPGLLLYIVLPGLFTGPALERGLKGAGQASLDAAAAKSEYGISNTSAGIAEVPSERPLSALALWWRWVWITVGIGALCWVVVFGIASSGALIWLLAGVPLFIGSFFLGRMQGANVLQHLPLSQPQRPGAVKRAWMWATVGGFLPVLVAPLMFSDLASGQANPMNITLSITIAGGALGTLLGLLQMLFLQRHWPGMRSLLWVPMNTLSMAVAALAWWLVFAALRAGGPPVYKSWFGPVPRMDDGLSTFVGGLAATFLYATVTASGLVLLYARQAEAARTRRDMALAGGLTGAAMLVIFALTVPHANRTTSIVTTVINPKYFGPTPTVEASMLGLKTQRVTSAPCGTWYYELSPMGGGGDLRSVEVVSEDEAWAIYGNSTVLRWKGNRLDRIDHMDLPFEAQTVEGYTYGDFVAAIEALSPDDVWLAGSSVDPANPNSAPQPWFTHWDGKTWTRIAGPDARMHARAMAAVSPDDIWAVGSTVVDQAETMGILHWDGKAWSAMPIPDVGGSMGLLNDVAAVSSNDVWAVGQYYDSNGRPSTLTIHWNGNQWNKVPSPTSKFATDSLQAVTALSSDDVWAVNSFMDSGWVPGVIHWDGTEWKRIPTEQLGSDVTRGSGGLSAVAATSPNDVWGAGFSNSKPLLLHWDGKAWSVVPSPSGRGGWGGIAATKGTLWAVGRSAEVPGYENVPMFARFVKEECPGSGK